MVMAHTVSVMSAAVPYGPGWKKRMIKKLCEMRQFVLCVYLQVGKGFGHYIRMVARKGNETVRNGVRPGAYKHQQAGELQRERGEPQCVRKDKGQHQLEFAVVRKLQAVVCLLQRGPI